MQAWSGIDVEVTRWPQEELIGPISGCRFVLFGSSVKVNFEHGEKLSEFCPNLKDNYMVMNEGISHVQEDELSVVGRYIWWEREEAMLGLA